MRNVFACGWVLRYMITVPCYVAMVFLLAGDPPLKIIAIAVTLGVTDLLSFISTQSRTD